MNRTRNGRIARLPRSIREELNRRLDEGEEGKQIIAWLNQLPEVIAQNETEHGGKPLRAQNLSEWRKGGYLDWLARQQVIEIAAGLTEEAAAWEAEGRAPIADALAHWAAGRYAIATRQIAATEGTESWRVLRDFCRDLVDLRKGDHSAERLRLERERLDLERERNQHLAEEQFWARALQPENREKICQGFLPPGQVGEVLRNLMFGPEPAPSQQGHPASSPEPPPHSSTTP